MMHLKTLCMLFIFIFLDRIEMGSSTSCSPLTGNICHHGQCESGVCSCPNHSTHWVPVRTGCVEIVPRPQLKRPGYMERYDHYFPYIYTTEVVQGHSVTLTCVTRQTEFTTFNWFKNNTLLAGAITNSLDVVANVPADLGTFQCQVNAGLFTSEKSNNIKLTMLKATSDVKPRIANLCESVTQGVKVQLTCANVPYGSNVTWQEKRKVTFTNIYGTKESKVKTLTSSMPVTINKDNEDSTWTCEVSAEGTIFSQPTSLEENVLCDGKALEQVGYNLKVKSSVKRAAVGDSVTFTCNEPKRFYEPLMVYEWVYSFYNYTTKKTVSETIEGANKRTFTFNVPPHPDHDDYEVYYSKLSPICRASYNGTPSGTATDQFSIVTLPNERYPNKDAMGQVTLSCTKPLYLSRISISALFPGSYFDDVYWTHNGNRIPRQKDKLLLIDGLSDSDTGIYEVVYTIMGRIFRYNTTLPPLSSTPSKPKVDISSKSSDLSVNGTYYLHCLTQSQTPGMLYNWYKNGEQVVAWKKAFTRLANVQPEHAGRYTCVVSFNNVSSQASDAKEVTVGPEGFYCESHGDCQLIAGATGRCLTARCTCKPQFLVSSTRGCISSSVGGVHVVVGGSHVNVNVSVEVNETSSSKNWSKSTIIGKECVSMNCDVGERYTGLCVDGRCQCSLDYLWDGQACTTSGSTTRNPCSFAGTVLMALLYWTTFLF